MCLINHNIVPPNFRQISQTNTHSFKASHKDIKFFRNYTVDQDIVSFFLSGDQFDDIALRQPFLEFVFPVTHCTFWHNDNVRTLYFFVLAQKCENGDGLNGFA